MFWEKFEIQKSQKQKLSIFIISLCKIIQIKTYKFLFSNKGGFINSFAVSGIEYLQKELKDKNITLRTTAIDKKFYSKFHIVPVLGNTRGFGCGNKL